MFPDVKEGSACSAVEHFAHSRAASAPVSISPWYISMSLALLTSWHLQHNSAFTFMFHTWASQNFLNFVGLPEVSD